MCRECKMFDCTRILVLILWGCCPTVFLPLMFGRSIGVLVAGGPTNSSSLVISASDTVARVGSRIQLTCYVDSGSETSTTRSAGDIEWFHVHHNETTPTPIVSEVIESTSQVVLPNVSFDDSGVYRCCLTDACADKEIHIGLPPDPASDLKCFSHNFRSAFCTWTRGGQNSNLDSMDRLEYSARGSEWYKCSPYKDAICNSTSCFSGCMELLFQYLYRIKTENGLDPPAVTDEVPFNAHREATLNPPYGVTVSAYSVKELLVKWHIPRGFSSSNEARSEDIIYILEYRWEGSPQWIKIEPKETDKDTEVTETYILGDLPYAYRLYYIKVKAKRSLYNPKTESNFSEIAEGRTSETRPTDKPGNCHAETILNTKNRTRHVVITWEPIPNEFKKNGEILDYVISFSSSEEGQPKVRSAGRNQTSYTVYDLKKDQHYIFTIQARNSKGKSPKAKCTLVTPEPAEPPPVGTILGVCISIVVLIIILVFFWYRVKHSIRKFPNITISLQTQNVYFSNTANHVIVREAEVFDELTPCQLFVDIGPKGTDEGAIFGDIMRDGFDIGDKPQGAPGLRVDIPLLDFESHPLLGLKDDPMLDVAPLSTEPLLPNVRREEELSSGEEYGATGPGSPVSVGSGGSYLHIRDDEELTYSCMTKEGLSPIEKESAEGRRIRGEGPVDSGVGASIDGLPELMWRQESVDEESDNEQSADIGDAYTKMAGHLPSSGASASFGPSAARGDERGCKPVTHPKGSAVGTHPEETSDSAGVPYVSEGSMSSYVQQGFVPGSTPQERSEPCDLNSNSASSYSLLGIQEGIRARSPHAADIDGGNQIIDLPGPTNIHQMVPSGSLAASDQTSPQPVAGQGSELDEYSQDAIDSYVLSAGTLPNVRPSSDTSQVVQDPSNFLQDSSSQSPNAASPLRVVPQSSGSTEPAEGQNGFNRPRALSKEPPLSDEEEELNYVSVGVDSDSLHDEDTNREPSSMADVNGYVTQGMVFGLPNSQPVGTVDGGAAASGYVDHEQLSNFSPPLTVPSPVHNNEDQGTGTAGYITSEQALDIVPRSPVNGSPANNNNNNSRSPSAVSDFPGPTDESALDGGYVTQERVDLMFAAESNVSNDELLDEPPAVSGVNLTPQAHQGYISPDQIANLACPNPAVNGHVISEAPFGP